MKQTDPLSQLRDVHLPDPVSWWPPAPGWWFVSIIALSALVALIYFLRHRLLNNRYRKIALNKLSQLHNHDKDNSLAVLEEIAAILRRVAMQAYGRHSVAPLSGDTWLEFLDRTGQTSEFTHGAAQVLGPKLYQPTVEADIEQVMLTAEKWIREHRQC